MKKSMKIRDPKKPGETDRKLDAFKKANVALMFLSPQERACVIKATAIIYGVALASSETAGMEK